MRESIQIHIYLYKWRNRYRQTEKVRDRDASVFSGGKKRKHNYKMVSHSSFSSKWRYSLDAWPCRSWEDWSQYQWLWICFIFCVINLLFQKPLAKVFSLLWYNIWKITTCEIFKHFENFQRCPLSRQKTSRKQKLCKKFK